MSAEHNNMSFTQPGNGNRQLSLNDGYSISHQMRINGGLQHAASSLRSFNRNSSNQVEMRNTLDNFDSSQQQASSFVRSFSRNNSNPVGMRNSCNSLALDDFDRSQQQASSSFRSFNGNSSNQVGVRNSCNSLALDDFESSQQLQPSFNGHQIDPSLLTRTNSNLAPSTTITPNYNQEEFYTSQVYHDTSQHANSSYVDNNYSTARGKNYEDNTDSESQLVVRDESKMPATAAPPPVTKWYSKHHIPPFNEITAEWVKTKFVDQHHNNRVVIESLTKELRDMKRAVMNFGRTEVQRMMLEAAIAVKLQHNGTTVANFTNIGAAYATGQPTTEKHNQMHWILYGTFKANPGWARNLEHTYMTHRGIGYLGNSPQQDGTTRNTKGFMECIITAQYNELKRSITNRAKKAHGEFIRLRKNPKKPGDVDSGDERETLAEGALQKRKFNAVFFDPAMVKSVGGKHTLSSISTRSITLEEYDEYQQLKQQASAINTRVMHQQELEIARLEKQLHKLTMFCRCYESRIYQLEDILFDNECDIPPLDTTLLQSGMTRLPSFLDTTVQQSRDFLSQEQYEDMPIQEEVLPLEEHLSQEQDDDFPIQEECGPQEQHNYFNNNSSDVSSDDEDDNRLSAPLPKKAIQQVKATSYKDWNKEQQVVTTADEGVENNSNKKRKTNENGTKVSKKKNSVETVIVLSYTNNSSSTVLKKKKKDRAAKATTIPPPDTTTDTAAIDATPAGLASNTTTNTASVSVPKKKRKNAAAKATTGPPPITTIATAAIDAASAWLANTTTINTTTATASVTKKKRKNAAAKATTGPPPATAAIDATLAGLANTTTIATITASVLKTKKKDGGAKATTVPPPATTPATAAIDATTAGPTNNATTATIPKTKKGPKAITAIPLPATAATTAAVPKTKKKGAGVANKPSTIAPRATSSAVAKPTAATGNKKNQINRATAKKSVSNTKQGTCCNHNNYEVEVSYYEVSLPAELDYALQGATECGLCNTPFGWDEDEIKPTKNKPIYSCCQMKQNQTDDIKCTHAVCASCFRAELLKSAETINNKTGRKRKRVNKDMD